MKRENLVLMLKFTRDFDLQRKRQKAIWFILLFSFLFFFPQISFPQIQKSFTLIKSVSIQIEGQPGGKDMKELIPVKEGEPFSLKRITESIKQLYSTGLFSDIQVIREGENEIYLTYIFAKRFFTREVFFLGKKNISRKKLKEELDSVREGSPFSEGKLRKAIKELKNILRSEGYFYPEISTSTKKNFKTSSVDVFFEIRSPKRFLVKKISLLGQVILPESRLREEMKTKEGRRYVPSVLEEDISKLKGMYKSMNYHRAEIDIEAIDFDEREAGVSITLKITPYERLEIVVRGAQIPLSLIKPIWEERIFEEWGLAEGEAKIIDYLRGKGYLFSAVYSSMEKGEDKIRVVYKVTPGEKYKIQDISFEGSEYFTPSELKEKLGIREKIPFVSWINGSRLFELLKEIEALYRRHGFSEMRVDLNFVREEKNVKALFYIEEGSQEKIESISVKGTFLFKPDELLKQISSYQGGLFFRPNIQKDVERLKNYYLEQGVRGTEIAPEVIKAGEDIYSVLFDIKEGKRVKIEKIIIAGNVITKKGTILQELRIKEGDYAYYELIRETKTRLEKLGIFTEIRIEEVFITPERENLIISLREGKRNYISLGIGLETKNEPRTFTIWNNVIRPRGTTEFIRSNMFGRAFQLSLVGQFSLKEKRGVISWEQPNFFGLPLQTYLNAWLEREERKSFSYDRRGISFTAIKSISKNRLFMTTLRWARTTIFNLQISESEIDRQHFPFSASSVSGSFIWDRRDDPFNPKKGSFFSFVLERAYPLFRAESDYLKNFIKYQNYLPVFSGITFSSIFRLGLGRGRMPIHERFFGGGSNSFRGEEFDELGPRDPDSLKPVGGKALLLLNFELTFPFLPSLRDLFGTFFYDKGNIFAKRKHVSLASLQDSVGVGIRYRTPLGPIRFELGWNLDAPKGEKKVLAFITIGNVF